MHEKLFESGARFIFSARRALFNFSKLNGSGWRLHNFGDDGLACWLLRISCLRSRLCICSYLCHLGIHLRSHSGSRVCFQLLQRRGFLLWCFGDKFRRSFLCFCVFFCLGFRETPLLFGGLSLGGSFSFHRRASFAFSLGGGARLELSLLNRLSSRSLLSLLPQLSVLLLERSKRHQRLPLRLQSPQFPLHLSLLVALRRARARRHDHLHLLRHHPLHPPERLSRPYLALQRRYLPPQRAHVRRSRRPPVLARRQHRSQRRLQPLQPRSQFLRRAPSRVVRHRARHRPLPSPVVASSRPRRRAFSHPSRFRRVRARSPPRARRRDGVRARRDRRAERHRVERRASRLRASCVARVGVARVSSRPGVWCG